MGLSVVQVGLWFSTFLLECVVCFLAFRRRLYLQLRVFSAYLGMLVLREVFLYWAYHVFGYSSRFVFYAFWLTQAIVLLLRAGSIAEIIWKASRACPGFRTIAGWLIALVSLLLVGRASWVVVHNVMNAPVLILGVEHHVEFTAAVILFLLFVLWIRYDVPLRQHEKLIAVGLFAYSLIQEVNDAVAQHWVGPYFHWRDRIRVVCFMVVLIVWIVALRKPLAAPMIEPAPAPVSDIREYMHYGTALLESLYRNLRKFRKTWGK
jgi:hypothetical protein